MEKNDNVIHHDFGGKARRQIEIGGASCEVLYADGEVILTRTQLNVGGKGWVTHGLYPAPR